MDQYKNNNFKNVQDSSKNDIRNSQDKNNLRNGQNNNNFRNAQDSIKNDLRNTQNNNFKSSR